ncbi:hypothetical protein EVAR_38057_1 [Eumeta japonica]|uniref:Uncharacterized protein n=1 Tax=Eumeta variegata TaxID=151549 RepID=A0A4C1W8E2_EUMVA|nr:hypothetical protein EVAR_38057_1 [Eumeta japonica]
MSHNFNVKIGVRHSTAPTQTENEQWRWPQGRTKSEVTETHEKNTQILYYIFFEIFLELEEDRQRRSSEDVNKSRKLSRYLSNDRTRERPSPPLNPTHPLHVYLRTKKLIVYVTPAPALRSALGVKFSVKYDICITMRSRSTGNTGKDPLINIGKGRAIQELFSHELKESNDITYDSDGYVYRRIDELHLTRNYEGNCDVSEENDCDKNFYKKKDKNGSA